VVVDGIATRRFFRRRFLLALLDVLLALEAVAGVTVLTKAGGGTGICPVQLAIFGSAGVGLALFMYAVVFRPLERAVLDAQTRLRAERDRAVAADLAKRGFVSFVSHELRTPMNGILGFAELLRQSRLSAEQRKQVEIIRSSGQTLLALVNDILDLSKIEAGQVTLVEEDFSLPGTIAEIADLLRGGASAKRLVLGVYVDPSLPTDVRGDPVRLRQVLINLVGNAIKFTERGSVAVRAVRAPSDGAGFRLRLQVRDTGIGIPADKHVAVFEPFTQIDPDARRRREGTGLGLAICRELAERMGGQISVESTPGRGSIFTFELPLTEAARHAPTAARNTLLGGGPAPVGLALIQAPQFG